MPSESLPILAPLPGWITATPAETLEAAAFKSGATLAHLTLATADDLVPQALWRDRLALAAAEVSARTSGRREGAAALRDALNLTKAGDDSGPAGNILRQWSRAVSRPISVSNLGRALVGVAPERIAVEFHPELTHLGSVFPLRFDPCDPFPTAARCGRHWSDHHGSLEPDPTSAASREAVAA